MSASNLNPDDLELPDLPDTIRKTEGLVIDSSDEFPLPSFEFDDDLAGADILFPEGAEPTQEDRRAAGGAQKSTPNLSLPDVELPKFAPSPPSPSVVELPPFPPEERSLDEDYFEAGLTEETKSKSSEPAGSPAKPEDKPADSTATRAVTQEQAAAQDIQAKGPNPPSPAAPPAPAVGQAHKISLPSVTLEPDRPDFSKVPTQRQEWTQPGPPEAFKPREVTENVPPPPPGGTLPKATPASANELFYEAKATKPQTIESPPVAPPPPPSEALLEQASKPEEDIPVDQYVRKVKIRRVDDDDKKRFRVWLPAMGLALLVAAYFTSTPLFDKMLAVPHDNPVLVVSSEPEGQVYAGEELLGDAPLSLNAEMAARSDIEIRKPGYETLPIPPYQKKEGETDKIHSYFKPLKAKPVSLSWAGLPEGSVVWWNGKQTPLANLTKAAPGLYTVKVKAKGRPAVSTKLDLKSGSDNAFAAGAQVQAALDKQPTQSIRLKAPDKKTTGKALSYLVESAGGEAFSEKVKSKAGDSASVVLPAAGKYKVSFEGNDDFKSVSKTFEVKAGESGKLEIALVKQPPAATAPAQGSSSGSYSQPQTYHQPTYSPPPRYYPSGGGSGGGSGGRIAPPAF